MFIIALILFVAGMLLTGLAFHVAGLEALVFAGGIILVSLALAIPVHFAQRR